MKKGEKNRAVKSPCVKRCSLDREKVCPACRRTIDEIIAWPDADDETRKRILEAVKIRIDRLKKQV